MLSCRQYSLLILLSPFLGTCLAPIVFGLLFLLGLLDLFFSAVFWVHLAERNREVLNDLWCNLWQFCITGETVLAVTCVSLKAHIQFLNSATPPYLRLHKWCFILPLALVLICKLLCVSLSHLSWFWGPQIGISFIAFLFILCR